MARAPGLLVDVSSSSSSSSSSPLAYKRALVVAFSVSSNLRRQRCRTHTKRSCHERNCICNIFINVLLFSNFLILLYAVVWRKISVTALHEFVLMISLDFTVFYEYFKLYSVIWRYDAYLCTFFFHTASKFCAQTATF